MDPCLAFYQFVLDYYATLDLDAQAANAPGLMALMAYVRINCVNMPAPPIPEALRPGLAPVKK